MNKKSLSLALFGSLILASSGTFTSCKDYDDDINSLSSRIDKNEASIAAIQKILDSGQWIKSVESITNGVKITLGDGKTFELLNGADGNHGTNGTNGKDGIVYTIGEDGYWYKDGEKTEWKAKGENGKDGLSPVIKDGYWWIGESNTGVKAIGSNGLTPYIKNGSWWIGEGVDAEELGQATGNAGHYYAPKVDGFFYKVDGMTGEETKTDLRWAPEEGNVITAAVTDGEVVLYGIPGYEDGYVLKMNIAVLSSLVFAPQAYVDGIEAMKAISLKYNEWTVKTSDAKPTKIGEIWQKSTKESVISQKVIAYYHLNPANINEKQIVKGSVKYVADDKEIVTRAQKFNPTVEQYELVTEKIDGKDCRMMKVTFGVTSEEIKALDASQVSTLALQVSVQLDSDKEPRVITSDYAAIYKTNLHDVVLTYIDYANFNANRGGHLYGADNRGGKEFQALDAIENPETFTLTATVAGKEPMTLDLKNRFTFCYKETADKTDAKPLTEKGFSGNLKDLGLEIEFAKSNYISGTNEQPQNPFFTLEDGVITSTVYGEIGPAAADRMPLIRVILKETATNKILNTGWVKIKIVKDDVGGIEEKYPSFGNIYLNCADFVGKTDLEFMNLKIYNALGLTKDEFQTIYKLNTEKTAANGKGDIEELKDDEGTQTSLVKWTIPQGDLSIAQNGDVFTKSVYYSATGRKDVIITLTTGELYKPEGTIDNSNKTPIFWDSAFNFIKLNVETVDDSKNCNYVNDLLHTFVGNKVVVSGVDTQFADFQNVKTRFVFDSSNHGRKFIVDGTTHTLYVSFDKKELLVDGNEKIAHINDADNYLSSKNPSFTLNESSDIAKKLLNKVGHKDLENTFYVTFKIVADNKCGYELPLTNATFDGKLLRPVDILAKKGASFTDGITNGDTKDLSKLIELSDWRDLKFDGQIPSFYTYYEVTSITVDKASILCDMLKPGSGEFKKLSEVNNNVDITHTPADVTTIATGAFGNITYKNAYNVAAAYTLRIPVKVTYKWGDIVEYVDVHVEKTQGN